MVRKWRGCVLVVGGHFCFTGDAIKVKPTDVSAAAEPEPGSELAKDAATNRVLKAIKEDNLVEEIANLIEHPDFELNRYCEPKCSSLTFGICPGREEHYIPRSVLAYALAEGHYEAFKFFLELNAADRRSLSIVMGKNGMRRDCKNVLKQQRHFKETHMLHVLNQNPTRDVVFSFLGKPYFVGTAELLNVNVLNGQGTDGDSQLHFLMGRLSGYMRKLEKFSETLITANGRNFQQKLNSKEILEADTPPEVDDEIPEDNIKVVVVSEIGWPGGGKSGIEVDCNRSSNALKLAGVVDGSWAAQHTKLSEHIGWYVVKVNKCKARNIQQFLNFMQSESASSDEGAQDVEGGNDHEEDGKEIKLQVDDPTLGDGADVQPEEVVEDDKVNVAMEMLKADQFNKVKPTKIKSFLKTKGYNERQIAEVMVKRKTNRIEMPKLAPQIVFAPGVDVRIKRLPEIGVYKKENGDESEKDIVDLDEKEWVGKIGTIQRGDAQGRLVGSWWVQFDSGCWLFLPQRVLTLDIFNDPRKVAAPEQIDVGMDFDLEESSGGDMAMSAFSAAVIPAGTTNPEELLKERMKGLDQQIVKLTKEKDTAILEGDRTDEVALLTQEITDFMQEHYRMGKIRMKVEEINDKITILKSKMNSESDVAKKNRFKKQAAFAETMKDKFVTDSFERFAVRNDAIVASEKFELLKEGMTLTRSGIRKEIFHYGRSQQEYESAFRMVLKIKGLYKAYWEVRVANEDLREQYMALYQQSEELKFAYDNLREGYEELHRNALQSSIDIYQGYEELHRNALQLQQALNELQDAYDILVEDYNDLVEEYKKLEKAYRKLAKSKSGFFGSPIWFGIKAFVSIATIVVTAGFATPFVVTATLALNVVVNVLERMDEFGVFDGTVGDRSASEIAAFSIGILGDVAGAVGKGGKALKYGKLEKIGNGLALGTKLAGHANTIGVFDGTIVEKSAMQWAQFGVGVTTEILSIDFYTKNSSYLKRSGARDDLGQFIGGSGERQGAIDDLGKYLEAGDEIEFESFIEVIDRVNWIGQFEILVRCEVIYVRFCVDKSCGQS
eukprot:gene11-777_t